MKATKLFDRHARNIRHGPGGKFAVSVFTQHVSMNVMHIHSAVPAQQVTEAGAIQHGAGTNDPSARLAGPLVGDVGQDVHGIADHDQNRRRILTHNLIHDARIHVARETEFAEVSATNTACTRILFLNFSAIIIRQYCCTSYNVEYILIKLG